MPTTSRPVRRLAAGIAAAVLLTACGDTAGTDDADDAAPGVDAASVTDETTDDEPADDGTTDDADGAPAADGLLALTATAPDGSTFRLADLADRPVLVETFATWCSTCRAQLGDTQQAAVEAGDDAVLLALSVETNLDPASLARYAAENGFDDIVFGVLDDDGLLALQERFGGSVLNPPSTPKFRVDADGSVSELTTGRESVEEILASLDA